MMRPATLAALHWGYPQAGPVVLPLGLALAGYTVWAYARQVRGAGRWAWVLAGLRVAALTLVAVSVLRPSVTRPRAAAERGPVVFVLDDSRSMAATDTGRPPGQRVAVAAALGRLPAGTRDAGATAVEAGAERLADGADAVARARADVGYARLAGRDDAAAAARLADAADAVRAAAGSVAAADAGRTPALGRPLASIAAVPASVEREAWLDRLADRARSAAAAAADARVAADARLYDDDPAVRDAADAVAGRPRIDLAWAAVYDPRAGLRARLGDGRPTVGFAVGDRVTPLAADPAPPPADGAASDLAGGVRAVLDRLAATSAPDADPPRAVVLVSDGRQVNGEPAESVAAAAAGVPVYTLAVASRSPSPNLAVTDLAVPPVVYPGEPVVVRATVRGTALAGVSTDVALVAGGGGPPVVRRVTLAGDRTAVALAWTPAGSGPVPVTVRVTPVAGEATPDDNAATRWTDVAAGPVRVTVLAAAGDPDAEAATAALAQAAGVRLTAGRFAAGPTASRPTTGPTTGPTVEDVGRSDVALLFGVTARSLSAAQWEAVERLVADRGGGVILAAGEGGFGPPGPPTTPLARLLPFAGPPPAWVPRPPGALRPTADPDAPRLADDPAEDARRWAAFPPADGHLPLTSVRPDTRVLADCPADGFAADAVPALVERRVGPGRVLCLGVDQTGRWRAGPAGGADAARFWTALVRTAAGRDYAAESGGVAVGADPTAVAPGQPVRVRLRLSGPDGLPPITPVACEARVLGPGGAVVRAVPLRPRAAGRYEGAVAGLPAGAFTVEATAAGYAGRPRVPLDVRPSFDAELADLAGDDGFLRRLADATGGRSYRLDQLDALAARLATPSPEPPRPVDLALWDGPYLYAAVLGLLTAEWALRRRAGLA